MKHIKNFNEEFDPMVGIDNFLENPTMVALMTAWLLTGDRPDNIEHSLRKMKDSFIEYCNLMGYTIDKDYLDSKFKEGILKIKEIISPKDENTKLY